jgi:hypothetical protein
MKMIRGGDDDLVKDVRGEEENMVVFLWRGEDGNMVASRFNNDKSFAFACCGFMKQTAPQYATCNLYAHEDEDLPGSHLEVISGENSFMGRFGSKYCLECRAISRKYASRRSNFFHYVLLESFNQNVRKGQLTCRRLQIGG